MVSVIIILESEHRGFVDYVKAMDRVLVQSGLAHEILIVANGTGDFIRACLSDIRELYDRLRIFEFRIRFSKADCLRAITKETRGDWLLIGASHQELTEDSMDRLINHTDASVDVIIPWRQKGGTRFPNRLYSLIFNRLVGLLTKNDFHDIGCSPKMCRREILEEMDFFGDVLRFLPVFAATKGYRIKEVPVEGSITPKARFFYSPTDYLIRLIEIFAIFFNSRFSSKPLRFFSAVGAFISLLGLISLIVLFIQRFFFDVSIGNRPSLFVSLLLMIMGVLVSSAGLLGEIIVFFNSRGRKEYTVEKIVM
ncbi:MAG: glycosyltransferase [Desulfobacterales bacterium]